MSGCKEAKGFTRRRGTRRGGREEGRWRRLRKDAGLILFALCVPSGVRLLVVFAPRTSAGVRGGGVWAGGGKVFEKKNSGEGRTTNVSTRSAAADEAASSPVPRMWHRSYKM